MAREFKKLSEVSVLETVSDSTTLIVVENGAIKQTLIDNVSSVDSTLSVEGKSADAKATGDAITNINQTINEHSESIRQLAEEAGVTVKTVNETAPDENGNVNITIPTTVPVIETATAGQAVAVKTVDENGVPTEWEAVDFPEGFSGSYNDLTNKPFYEADIAVVLSDTYNFRGGIIPGVKEYSRNGCLLMSAMVPGDTYIVTFDGIDYEGVLKSISTEYGVDGKGVELFSEDFSDAPVWVYNYTDIMYAMWDDDENHTFKLTHLTKEIKSLDPKFLPTTVPVIETATAGQTVAVKTVDENGVPTEWEAADFPEGFSGSYNDLTDKPNMVKAVYGEEPDDNGDFLSAIKVVLGKGADNSVVGAGVYINGRLSVGAFIRCSDLTHIELPNLTVIGSCAFEGCSSLLLESLPDTVTSIEGMAFFACYNLPLASLPEGLTYIGSSAFRNCFKLAITSIPASVENIGSDCFGRCSALTTITFKGTPTKIGYKAFDGCSNLTTINVPWAEGAVAYAPWGATNATINYNYTGE